MTTCPSCRGVDTLLFHEQRDLPVHSCILVDGHDEAVGFPRGDLDLHVCRSCGFIFNSVFDRRNSAYSESYEETQGFSPTFRAFAASLAQRWIERYDLRGKRILEIGCGKGEFLELLCRLGDNQGIGIDPSYVPGRLETTADVQFLQELFAPEHTSIEADAIVCRHTLEHIPDVADFMALVRATVGDRTDTILLFELPDVLRVLREAAWWDIYYEHCSYFTPGTLVRLFERSGFEVLALELDFDDQYILVEARLAGPARVVAPPLAEPLSVVLDAVEDFRDRKDKVLDHWRRRLDDVRGNGGRTAIWGAGSKGVAFVAAVGDGGVDVAVDINPHKQGRFLPGGGQAVVGPDALTTEAPDLVIAMNPIYVEEIRAALDAAGIVTELEAV